MGSVSLYSYYIEMDKDFNLDNWVWHGVFFFFLVSAAFMLASDFSGY